MPVAKPLVTSALALFLFTVGCAPNGQQQGLTTTRDTRPNGDGVGAYGSMYKNDLNGDGFRTYAVPDTVVGYASLSPDALRSFGGSTRVYVDRNVLAQAAAKVALSVPGVRHATVAVTDRRIMVGVTLNTSRPAEALNQVKKGVQSIAPGYYRISVSADEDAVRRYADQAASAGRTPTNMLPGRTFDRP
ncbi:MAG TPA: YhcN/YlaJ family sporulation lipoprotein [Calditerricola sp.]